MKPQIRDPQDRPVSAVSLPRLSGRHGNAPISAVSLFPHLTAHCCEPLPALTGAGFLECA